MKRDEDGEWHRLEPRPDLAIEDEVPPRRRRRPRPSPGKVTRTLSLPAAEASANDVSARQPEPDRHPSDASPPASLDAFPDVFGGALPPPSAPAPTSEPATPGAIGDGDVAAAKAAIDRAFAAQRDAILAAAADQGPALQQAAAATHTKLIGDIATRETTIRATFSQARGAVRTAERTQIALARSDALAVTRRLRAAATVRQAYRDAADTEARRVTSTIRMDGALITGSADGMYAKLDAASGNALRNANVELRDADGEVANDALAAARDATRKQLRQWVVRDWTDLLGAGTRSASALRKSADEIAEQAAAPLADAADDISSAGDMLAAAISHGAEQQLEELASAERELLSSLARLRTSAAAVLQAARIAEMRLRQDAAARVGALGRPQAAAHRALDTVAPAGPEAIVEMRDHAVSAAADAGRDVIAGLRAAPTALTAVVDERRARLAKELDEQLAASSADVGPAPIRFTNECNAHRAQAVQDYSAAETQLTTQALSQLAPATAAWRTEADRFITDAGKLTSAVLQQHRDVERGLDAHFIAIAREAVRLNRRSRGERAADTALAGVRGLGRGAVNFGIDLGKLMAINIAAGTLGGLGLLAAGAYAGYNAFAGAKHRVDQLRSVWHQRSTAGKFLAFEETTRVIIADQLGLTGLVEGILHHEAITHRTLSSEEAGARYSEAALQLFAFELIARRSGTTHEPPRAETSRQADAAAHPSTRAAASPPQHMPKACFVAGTLAWTPNGLRPIEEISPGDDVVTIDVASGAMCTCVVVAVEVQEVDAIIEMAVADERVLVTDEHPFWIPEIGWRKAGALEPAHRVRACRGDAVVTSVQRRVGNVTVFNLRVDGAHTFLVSRAGLLVHNKGNVNEFFANREKLIEQLDGDLVSAAEIRAETSPTGAPGKADLSARADLAARLAAVERDIKNARDFATELTIDNADALELSAHARLRAKDEIAALRVDVAEARKPFEERRRELVEARARASKRIQEVTIKNDAILEAAGDTLPLPDAVRGASPAPPTAAAKLRRKRLVKLAERMAAVERFVDYLTEDRAGDSGITTQKARVASAHVELDVLESELATGHMFGARGPQITSKTLWLGDDGYERIDVENPSPGERPGQIHYQPARNKKWYYDQVRDHFYNQETGEIAPPSVQEKLTDPEIRAAVDEGLRQLGESR